MQQDNKLTAITFTEENDDQVSIDGAKHVQVLLNVQTTLSTALMRPKVLLSRAHVRIMLAFLEQLS